MTPRPNHPGSAVTIIGCGSIGSHIGELLARLTLDGADSPIHLIDFDKVEGHNLRSQNFSSADVGQLKTAALKHALTAINPAINVTEHSERAQSITIPPGFVFLNVDRMSDRKEVVQKQLRGRSDVLGVIETRMGGPNVIVHTFDPNNAFQLACWFEYWFPDSEADAIQGCSAPKSMSVEASLCATLAVAQFKKFAALGSTSEAFFHKLNFNLETMKMEKRERWVPE